MRYILAVDSGGSKCETVLVREDGVVLGWGICRIPGLSGRSPEAITRATRDALSFVPVEALYDVRVACLDSEVAEGLFGAEDRFTVHVHVVGEYEGALYLSGYDHGVVALAGTGAFVHVKTPDGRSVRFDSYGPMLGDWGSGYQIGLMAMRATMRASWHPRHQTRIREMVLTTFSVDAPLDLVPMSLENPDRCVVAALARGVAQLAEEGDLVARRIVEEAAEDLADTLRDAVESMDLTGMKLPMVGTGSVVKQSRIYWEHLCNRTATFAPQLIPVLEPMPSAAGMAMALLHRFPAVDEKTARENLIESAGKFLERIEPKTQ